MAHEDRRQELIEVATRVFLQYGYRKTTLDDIAEAARLQKSSLYHYFDNRDDLFRAVVENIHSGMLQKFVAVLPGRKPLMKEMGAFVEVMRSELDRMQPNMEFMFDDMSHFLPLTKGLLTEFIAQVNSLVAGRIQKAVDDGELKPCPVDDLVIILAMFLMRAFKAREFSEQHALAADNAMHYVEVLFEPYFTKSSRAAS